MSFISDFLTETSSTEDKMKIRIVDEDAGTLDVTIPQCTMSDDEEDILEDVKKTDECKIVQKKHDVEIAGETRSVSRSFVRTGTQTHCILSGKDTRKKGKDRDATIDARKGNRIPADMNANGNAH